MGERGLVAFPLSCPKCGRSGKIVWSENHHPYRHEGGSDYALESVSEGFIVEDQHDKDDEPDIICEGCKIVVNK